MAFVGGFVDCDIDRVVNICRTLDGPFDLDDPFIANGPNGLVSSAVLPLMPFTATSRVLTVVDVISHMDGLDLNSIFGILHVKNYNNLPPELKPAVGIPAPLKMQFVVTANPDGTHHVLKFFHFMRPTPVDIAKSICVGEVKSIQTLSINPALHKKSAQWLLEQMGGLQLLWFCLTPPPAEIAEMVDIDKGFDFIEEKAPRDSTGTKQLRWSLR